MRLLSKLALLAFFVSPGALTLVLAAFAVPLAVYDVRRTERLLVRVEHFLTLAAFLLLLTHQLPLLRGMRDRAEAEAAALGETLGERLERDAELLRDVTRRIGPDLSPADPAGVFDFLREVSRELPLEGRGIKLFTRAGKLVAWYGETLDGGEHASRLGVSIPAVGAWLVVEGGNVGAVLRSLAPEWRVVLEDPWLRRSPVEALGLARGGWLAHVERRRGIEVLFDRGGPPAGSLAASLAEERATAPLRLGGRRAATVEAPPVAATSVAESIWLRLAALCFLAGLLLLLREAWCAIEGRLLAAPDDEQRVLKGWLLPLGLKAVLLLVFRWVLEAGDFLRTLLPGPVSSPLSFASRALGPFTSSPADLLITGMMAALLALDAFRGAAREPALVARPSAVGSRTGRWWTAAVLLALLALGVLFHRRLFGGGTLVVRDTSTELLLRPNLYSTPEGAFLFAGLVGLVVAFILAVATLFVVVLRTTEPEPGSSLPARFWLWTFGVSLLLALAAALHLDRSAPDFSPSLLTIVLWGVAIAGGLALAGTAVAADSAERRWTWLILGPALILGLTSATVVVTAHGAGRMWGVRQAMAGRLEEVGQPSNQWLEYNLRITGERLAGAGGGLAALGSGEEGAAFVTWTRTPLRDLPFPSALMLADGKGALRSRFSLLPPRDLELLPGIARAALRVPSGHVYRIQTETGRTLFFTAAPWGDFGEGRLYAIAVLSEALEPSPGEETAGYFLRDVFSAEQGDPFLFALHRGEPLPTSQRSLTLASGSGDARLWISLPLGGYLPESLDYLSLCLTVLAGSFAFLILYQALLGTAPVPWPRGWRNPLATFRGRVFSVLLASVSLPVIVYSWISFHTTRHEIEQATRALAEDALRTAAAFLGPRLRAGGVAELEAILPEAARVVGQDLIVYRGGEVQGSNRPEIFQANLFSRRMPGDLYRRLAFAGERLATERARWGRKEVLIAYMRTPWSSGDAPYILASPLLLREEHIARDLRGLLQVLFVMFAMSLLALGIFSWRVSRQLSSPLATLKEGADRIAAGELGHRLRDPERSDEFGRLFSAFNTMAAGLQVSQGELLAEKERIQAILSSTGAGVIALDREGRVQLANQAARDLLGLPADVVGRRLEDLPPGVFWERVARGLKLDQRREDEVRLAGANGGRTLHLAFAPLRGERAQRRGLVVVFEDISGALASQRALAWEEMARQVAHEIKNPLTPIKLSLQHLHRLQRRPPENFAAILEKNLDLVLSEIGRLERIAGEFSRFGAAQRPAEPIEPERTLREVVDLYAQQRGDDTRFELVVRGRPTAVLADHDGLKKVLVNLLENAREAMDGGRRGLPGGVGTVRVELDYDASSEQALVRVRDRGPGIRPEDLDRLFQPYFSTKTRGAGLGLAIARRIVESWGGRIEARNWEEGAEVLLWLGKSPGPA